MLRLLQLTIEDFGPFGAEVDRVTRRERDRCAGFARQIDAADGLFFVEVEHGLAGIVELREPRFLTARGEPLELVSLPICHLCLPLSRRGLRRSREEIVMARYDHKAVEAKWQKFWDEM